MTVSTSSRVRLLMCMRRSFPHFRQLESSLPLTFMNRTRVLLLLLSFFLATLWIFGTIAFATSDGMNFICPELVHAGDIFTVNVEAVEGAEHYSVYFWLDGHTNKPRSQDVREARQLYAQSG